MPVSPKPATSYQPPKPAAENVESPVYEKASVPKKKPEAARDDAYRQAYTEMEQLLAQPKNDSFKRAVFITENAYFGDSLDYGVFNSKIAALAAMCRQMKKSNRLAYEKADSAQVATYAAAFSLMTAGVPVQLDSNKVARFPAYRYGFEDFNGDKEWPNMFVTKLLLTHEGNCHSLPFLYKILVAELGETAHLALAPNHIYIKHRIQKGGWYNTELTSGVFPVDAWLMASGYITLDAIRNGVYMKALDERQSLAICLTDLAQGYQRKFGTRDGAFIIKSCELALQYFPGYINARLLQAETQKQLFEQQLKKNANGTPEAAELLEAMTKNYTAIHQSGYRKMPDGMYADWLSSLKAAKAQYQNKNLNFKRPE